jgi:hypothetical protein
VVLIRDPIGRFLEHDDRRDRLAGPDETDRSRGRDEE